MLCALAVLLYFPDSRKGLCVVDRDAFRQLNGGWLSRLLLLLTIYRPLIDCVDLLELFIDRIVHRLREILVGHAEVLTN